MMDQSQQRFGSEQFLDPDMLHENMIKKTCEIIKQMTQIQKFEKARAHVIDALKYKHPRHQSQSLQTPRLFKLLYAFQSNSFWQWILFLSGWIFICLAAIDNQSYKAKIGIESTILILFWIDTLTAMYCKSFDNFYKKRRYSYYSYFKIIIILLMTADLIIFIILPCHDSRPIRPFRVLRCAVPLLFDPEMRKSLYSLASTYKDVLVYFIFFTFIIVGYALLGNRAFVFDPHYKDPTYPQNVDPYRTNYDDLGKMIYILYVTATYDSYPDNQNLATQNYQPNIIYFIVFIFANMFLFSSIPGSIIYLKFKDTRSKILLIDEIRQQHSLLLAYVTLAYNEPNLSMDRMIKFLLYLYKYKIRYVQYITDICLRINDNNNRTIQVNQFTQLSKILSQNSVMLPPAFDDVEYWIKFRRWVIANCNLKMIVMHWIFELIVSVIIILSFINAIFFMFYPSHLVIIFDGVFVWVFAVQLLIRIIAYGFQAFFRDKWNISDTMLVIFGIAFFFVPNSNNADGIIRMSRIFRLATLFRLISHSHFIRDMDFQMFSKITNIFAIILDIMPIILKFMHLFAFFFYIYSIVGMELFYNFYDAPAGIINYNNYAQFGNFANLINSLMVMVQILTEAGWSQIAYDHSWRAPYYYGYILLYFCLMHITIVYIIATLIKGIFWQVFFTVNQIFENRKDETIEEQQKEDMTEKKSKQILEVNKAIENNIYLEPDTLLKRQLIQDRFNILIFGKLIKAYEEADSTKNSRSKKAILAQILIDNVIQNSKGQIPFENKNSIQLEQMKDNTMKKKMSLPLQQGDKVGKDRFAQISQILQKIIVDPSLKYSELTISPKVWMKFLRSKLKSPEMFIKAAQFNMHKNPLNNQQSMSVHINQIHGLLSIEPSKLQQKILIIRKLVEEGILSEQLGYTLVRKKLKEKDFNIDSNGALRMVFLAGTNEDLVKKFESQYFSQLYGHSYRCINKMTLQPLLKLQATLIHSLGNILRYPQIKTTDFFQMITHIQDKISNKLLHRGSLFKFVYKLDCEGDIWFTIQYKKQQQIKIHFIKTGIWCYDKEMVEKKIVYGRDIFHLSLPNQNNLCRQYIKLFFQSFQSLAFSLLDKEQFFKNDPCLHVYDLYLQHFDLEKIQRYQYKKLQISKIMVAILSKGPKRADIGLQNIGYSLSDIKRRNSKKKNLNFRIDEEGNQTFQKMKNLGAKEVEKIVDSEGLPFSYILNLMKQVSEIITINGQNFIYQIERIINEKYADMKQNLRNKQESPLKK